MCAHGNAPVRHLSSAPKIRHACVLRRALHYSLNIGSLAAAPPFHKRLVKRVQVGIATRGLAAQGRLQPAQQLAVSLLHAAHIGSSRWRQRC